MTALRIAGLASSRSLPSPDYADLDIWGRRAGYPGARAPGFSQRSHAIGRALDAARPPVEDVGVDHGRAHVPVPQELLDGADILAVLEQVGGEGVAQGVTGGGLGDARTADGVLD